MDELLDTIVQAYEHLEKSQMQSPVKQRASPERTARLSGTNGV